MRAPLSRRHFLRTGAVGLGIGVSGWMQHLLQAAEADKTSTKKHKSCILLWMNGGPSTIDMWDLKPGHENGGSFRPTKTSVPDLSISEHLPKLAQQMKHLAVIRSMSTKEGDHGRATYLMHTGQLPMTGGNVDYPTFGSLLSKELGNQGNELPNFISISPQRFFNLQAFGPGFLGPKFAPLIVGEGAVSPRNVTQEYQAIDNMLRVQNLHASTETPKSHAEQRLELLKLAQEDFHQQHPDSAIAAHLASYERATKLMLSERGKVFDLSQEKPALRDRYGKNFFGQGCLLARRLVEARVPFIEVTLGGWDTHGNNFDAVKGLSSTVDEAWSALLQDLQDRGLLESTLILWMGEFGRTPKINRAKGRDHYPNAWSAVLAGCGIKGGQAFGKTSDDGTTVESAKTSTADLLATACQALGIDFEKTNMSNIGRPIRLVDKTGTPVKEVLS